MRRALWVWWMVMTIGCGTNAEPTQEAQTPWPLSEPSEMPREEPPAPLPLQDDAYWGKLLVLTHNDKMKNSWGRADCGGVYSARSSETTNVLYTVNHGWDYNRLGRQDAGYRGCIFEQGGPAERMIACLKYPACGAPAQYLDPWRHNVYLDLREVLDGLVIKLELDYKLSDMDESGLHSVWNIDMARISEDFKDYNVMILEHFAYVQMTIYRKGCDRVSLEEATRAKDKFLKMRVFYENEQSKALYEPESTIYNLHHKTQDDLRAPDDPSRRTHFFLSTTRNDMMRVCHTSVR